MKIATWVRREKRKLAFPIVTYMSFLGKWKSSLSYRITRALKNKYDTQLIFNWPWWCICARNWRENFHENLTQATESKAFNLLKLFRVGNNRENRGKSNSSRDFDVNLPHSEKDWKFKVGWNLRPTQKNLFDYQLVSWRMKEKKLSRVMRRKAPRKVCFFFISTFPHGFSHCVVEGKFQRMREEKTAILFVKFSFYSFTCKNTLLFAINIHKNSF